jgi:hypothetical protein
MPPQHYIYRTKVKSSKDIGVGESWKKVEALVVY